MKKSVRVLAAAALAIPLFFSGCARPPERADLVFLNGAEPETIDPALITGQPEGRIASALFEGLTTFNAAAEAVPGVAERWEISPDGRVYTFHLRENARWSNGAFTLEAWRLNDRVRLKKNPFYWNADHVAMRTVDVLPSARANTAFNYYATGLADLMMDKGLAPTPLMAELKKRSDFHSAPFLGTYFIRFNASRAPFNDARVRKAFSLVMDKSLLVEKITKAGEVPAPSLVPPGTAGYEPPAGLQRNPEQARSLLAEAGFPNGKNFPRVSYLYEGDSDLDRDLAVEIQGMIKRELGIEHFELQPQEWKVYLRSMSALDYDLARSSWVGDYKDPNTFLDMFVTNGGNNRTGWSNANYDQLIAQ